MKYLKAIITILVALACSVSYGQSEELRILCWEGYAPPKYTQKFEKLIETKYGIDLKVTVTHVSDPQEFFDKIRGRKVDLISPAHNIPKSDRWKFIKAKVVLPIDLENIPNYKKIIPSLQKANYITQNGKVYGVPIVYGPYGLAYNTKFFKEPPTSWNVLWDAKYAGKYTISSDYHESNIYSTALALGFNKQQIFDFEIFKDNQKMKRRLRTLAQNAKSLWIGVDEADGLQGLALATAWGFSFPELKKRGEIWKFAQPKEGTTGWVDNWLIGYSLKKNYKMKRIAEEWINYSIGVEMQVDYVRSIGQFPVNLSIKEHLTPEEVKIYHLDDPSYFKNNLILWKVLSTRHQNGFKVMWEKAKRK